MSRRKPKRNRKRDYRAEYKRRVERGLKRGYTRDIIRGHPREGTIGISLAAKLKVPAGTAIEDITYRDVRAEIPNHPWELQGDDPKAIKAALKEEGFTELRGIEFTDQETFVKQMLAFGFTYREAFDLYFGY